MSQYSPSVGLVMSLKRRTDESDIRLSLCQLFSCPGNVERNIETIEAHLRGCSAFSDLVVFPEVGTHRFFLAHALGTGNKYGYHF